VPFGWDRVKASLFALVGAADPRAQYRGLYRGTVVSQDGDVVDLQMDDPGIPGCSGLPIQVGIPGSSVQFVAGARMLLAFENGDPAKPIALCWDAGAGATVSSLTLGSSDALEAVLHGTSLREADNALWEALDLAFDAMQAVSNGALSPLKAPVAAIQAAIKSYRATCSANRDFLSQIVKVA
jgi:hypothetical protein